ncbi:MAG: methionine aminotransferase [Bacteroidota bacterium]
MNIPSKLPAVGTTIFTVMSALAQEHQAINLSQGFPDFDCPEGLKERVIHYLQAGKNQYVPMGGLPELRAVLAEKIEDLYGLSVDAGEEITITAGATQAIFTALAAFVHPGDEVILIEPAYDCYRPAIELMGAKPVIYELSGPDFQVDWDEFGSLISKRTRMVIINTPQNPIGKTFKKADMEALRSCLAGTDILLLSDEVYEHLVFDGKKHWSALRFEELFARTLATYSFGKTFHNTGWKVGYCVAPRHLMQEFRKVHQFNVFSVNSFVQFGLADFLQQKEQYVSLPEFYQSKRDYFAQAMAASSLVPLSSEGTYFQLFDYGHFSQESDTEFVRRLTIKYGVAAIPVSVFYSSGKDQKYIRLCFAKKEDTLDAAAKRLALL